MTSNSYTQYQISSPYQLFFVKSFFFLKMENAISSENQKLFRNHIMKPWMSTLPLNLKF